MDSAVFHSKFEYVHVCHDISWDFIVLKFAEICAIILPKNIAKYAKNILIKSITTLSIII